MSSHANEGEPPAVEGTSPAPAGAVPAQLPADLAAADSDPVQPAPLAAVLATPADATPGQPGPVDAATTPAETLPAQTAPAETVPAKTVPAETVPAQTAPAETVAAETLPAEVVPVQAAPPDDEATGAGTGNTTPGLAAAGVWTRTMVLDPMPLRHTAAAPPEEPVSKLAIAALVTAVVALVPIAVACGVASMVGIRRTARRGRGMAVAALFVSAAWLIVAGAIGTVGALTHGFHKPVTITYKQSAVFALRVGDCIGSPGGTVLPCSIPHAAEVFATFSLPDSAWPGTSAVASRARSGCGSRLTGYLNPQLAITLAQSYVYPDKTAWQAGTRTVICEVRAASGELTGSVRGAR